MVCIPANIPGIYRGGWAIAWWRHQGHAPFPDMCDFKIPMGKLHLPRFPIPKEYNTDDQGSQGFLDEKRKFSYKCPTCKTVSWFDPIK